MTAAFDFPGGVALLNPDRVWVDLELFRVNGGRFTIDGSPLTGITCVLRKRRQIWTGRSKLGPADAVANALEAYNDARQAGA